MSLSYKVNLLAEIITLISVTPAMNHGFLTRSGRNSEQNWWSHGIRDADSYHGDKACCWVKSEWAHEGILRLTNNGIFTILLKSVNRW